MPKKSDIAQNLSKSDAPKSAKAKLSASVVEVKELTEPNKGGRPTSYNSEVVAVILSRMALGESLVNICKDDGLPSRATVMRWLQEDSHIGFRDNYARAREEQADYYAEQIIEISDEECIYVKHGDGDEEKEVEVAFDSAAVARNRLRVDARKWYASKVAPKKYGDKLSLDAEINVTQQTPEQRAAKIAKLTAKLQQIQKS